MDRYKAYVKDLRAQGYSSAQIWELLATTGLDSSSIQILLSNSRTGVEAMPSPLVAQKAAGIQADAILQAYITYIRTLLANGISLEEVDRDLAAYGVKAQTRTRLLQVATQPSTTKAQPEDLDAATEHLIEAADHLAEVADTLEGVWSKKIVAPRTAGVASAEQAVPVDSGIEHLASVTDHLSVVAGTLKTAEKQSGNPSFENDLPHSQPAPASIVPSVSQNVVAEQTRKPVSGLRAILLAVGLIVYSVILTQSLLTGQRTVTWLALLSMNVVGTVGFDLLLRRSSWKQKDKWHTATVMQTGLFLPFFAKELIAPIHFPAYTPFDLLLLGCAVVALIGLQFFNVKALQNLEASVFSVIYNVRILFATLLGTFFLSESVGLWALIGGLLIFAAIFIVRQKGMQAITAKGILFGLGAALAISVMNTCEKELIKLVGYEQYIFPMFAIATLVMWVVVLIRRTPSPFRLLLQPQSLLLMFLRACAGIGFSYSLVFGPVAVSSYISSLSVVFLVLFGMIFLNELDFIKSKLWATVMALVGLTFILIDSFH